MRLLRMFAVILVPATCLTACTQGDTPDGTAPAPGPAGSTAPPTTNAPATSSAPAWNGPTIPDGTYAKTVTRADAKAAGVAGRQGVIGDFGKSGSVTYTYKFSGDRWTIFIAAPGGAPEPGDSGTQAYAPGREVAMTSESEGCPQCVYTYRWRLAAERLRLTIVGHDSTDAPEDLAAVRFITEGVFTRQP